MRILLVTQYFYPENFKSNDIAFELQKKGHQVTVLTGIPNYPQGHFFEGYGLFKKRIQTINNVKVFRAALSPRGNNSGIKLALNYLSWAFFASLWATYLAIRYRFDAIIVHEPSPITQGIPAVVVKAIQKIPIYFWVLDLWPESLAAAGGVKNKTILRLFYRLTRFLYLQSDKLLISSHGFRDSILDKGSFGSKIIYFPNWAEKLFDKQDGVDNLPALPKGFKVVFAGNIGEAQDIANVLKCCKALSYNKEIHFIFVGDGRGRAVAELHVQEYNLTETVHFVGRYPIEYIPSFYQVASLLLFSLKDEKIFENTVPSKLQTYLAAGKPIIGMINGEGQKLVHDIGCGKISNAGDYSAMAESINYFYELSSTERDEIGRKGRAHYQKYFTMDVCINNLEQIISNSK